MEKHDKLKPKQNKKQNIIMMKIIHTWHIYTKLHFWILSLKNRLLKHCLAPSITPDFTLIQIVPYKIVPGSCCVTSRGYVFCSALLFHSLHSSIHPALLGQFNAFHAKTRKTSKRNSGMEALVYVVENAVNKENGACSTRRVCRTWKTRTWLKVGEGL